MRIARCYECGKKVSQLSTRYAKDPKAKYDLHKGTITGERMYGPDCYAKLLETGAIDAEGNAID